MSGPGERCLPLPTRERGTPSGTASRRAAKSAASDLLTTPRRCRRTGAELDAPKRRMHANVPARWFLEPGSGAGAPHPTATPRTVRRCLRNRRRRTPVALRESGRPRSKMCQAVLESSGAGSKLRSRMDSAVSRSTAVRSDLSAAWSDGCGGSAAFRIEQRAHEERQPVMRLGRPGFGRHTARRDHEHPVLRNRDVAAC